MIVGKQIKVVMTLDDSGFKYKVQGVKDDVKSLETGLGNFSGSADRVDSSIKTLGSSLQGFGSGFASMQKGLTEIVQKLNQTVSGLNQYNTAQKESAKVAKDSATASIDAKKRSLEFEVEANKKLLRDRGNMHAELRKLESNERAKSTAAMMKAEDAERRMGSYGGKNIINAALNDADRHERTANAISREVAAIDKWILATRNEQATRLSNIASLEQERVATIQAAAAKENLAKIAEYVSKRNAAEVARVTKASLETQKQTDKEAKKSAEDAQRYKKELADQEIRDRRSAEIQKRIEIAETARTQRRLAQEAAAEQRREMQAIAQMWKSMAQMYAGAKIRSGLSSSVGGGSNIETARVTVSALNLPAAEQAQVLSSAEELTKQLKFINNLDAIQSKMSAISSIGYNNVKVIDGTLAMALKATNNLQEMGYGHGDMQSALRNIYGVTEMRQQTKNVEAMNRTFDLLQRSVAATGGKVQVNDIETVLRKVGGGASTMSDDGLINMVALVDQFKVSGGDGGGGGVATVGTILKMMQAYATGKGKSQEAMREFMAAGIMSSDGVNLKNDGANIFKGARNANFKEVDLWIKDPVAAIQKMVPTIVEYTKRDDQKAKFYQNGLDTNNEKNQMLAVQQYLQRLGIQQTAIQVAMAAGSPEAAYRNTKQAQTIKNSKGVNEVDAELSKTYQRQVTEVSKELDNFKMLVGEQLLPPLKEVLSVVNSIFTSASKFAKENPIATQFTAIAAAGAGAYLSLRGMLGLFGAFGSLTGTVGTLMGSMLGLKTATVAAGTAAGASGGLWGMLRGSVASTFAAVSLGAAKHMPALNASMLGMAASISGGGSAGSRVLLGFRSIATGAGAMAKMVSGAFLRMVPLLGQLLLAWDIVSLIAGLEVGGVAISAWVVGFADRTLTTFKNLWIEVKKVFSDGAGKVALEAEKARNDAELKARLKANGMGEKEPKPEEKEKEKISAEKPKEEIPKVKSGKPPQMGELTDNDKKLLGMFEGESNRKRKDFGERVDPLTRALETAVGDVKADTKKLESLLNDSRNAVSLQEEVYEELNGKRLSGDFNEDRDKNKPVGETDARFQKLVQETTQRRLLAEQIKAITFANERNAAATLEANEAMERLTGGNIEKQTDAFRALGRELARAEERLTFGAKAFEGWEKMKAQALYQRASADSANYAADLGASTKQINADNVLDPRKKLESELRATREAEQRKFEMLEKTRKETFEREKSLIEAKINFATSDVTTLERSLAEKAALEEEYAERSKAIAEKRKEYMVALAEKERLAMRDPFQRMVDEWKATTETVGNIQRNAAEGFVSMLTGSLGQGRMEIGNFLKAVLMDIANSKIKDTLAAQFKNIGGGGSGGGGIGGWLGQLFGTGPSFEAATAADRVAPIGAEQLGGFDMSSFFTFANGGIMTNYGEVELRKYANGGIANKPQLALYGEAGPEAYVPLPDGRTIPVTMTGGGEQSAPSVTVNVINQSGTQVAAQQGAPRFDGKAMILDVVLSAVTTPGQFRDGMKSAMRA